MQPIFKEMIGMWSDLGFPLPLKEGIYWLDNNFVKAFTRDGELHKLYKYKVFDDLHIEIIPCKSHKTVFSESDFETWEETIERNKDRLIQLETDSLNFIKKTFDNYADYEFYILTSTGKDSMVTLDLVHRVNPDVKVVFNNTSLDCADTYKMVKAHKDWIITNPKEGFYQYIKAHRYIPNRVSRGCCTMFKEGNSMDFFGNIPKLVQFMGVRNDESAGRADREDITHNPKWGDKDWYGCLPIRRYSDFDVWLYIFKHNIEVNTKYRKGYHRCGCAIACPYTTKYTWVLDKYWYPTMRTRWENILREVFTQDNRWTKLNCTIDEYILNGWNGTLYRKEPTEKVINEFMKYKGLADRKVALQYFNKTCECGKNVRQNDVLAMNLKLHGRKTNKIYCKKCLMKELKMSKQDWDNAVADFKNQGCTLF